MDFDNAWCSRTTSNFVVQFWFWFDFVYLKDYVTRARFWLSPLVHCLAKGWTTGAWFSARAGFLCSHYVHTAYGNIHSHVQRAPEFFPLGIPGCNCKNRLDSCGLKYILACLWTRYSTLISWTTAASRDVLCSLELVNDWIFTKKFSL